MIFLQNQNRYFARQKPEIEAEIKECAGGTADTMDNKSRDCEEVNLDKGRKSAISEKLSIRCNGGLFGVQ